MNDAIAALDIAFQNACLIDHQLSAAHVAQGQVEPVQAGCRHAVFLCGHVGGAEIAARASDELFLHLDAPVRRLGAKDIPVAFSPLLEEATLPQIDDVVTAAREVLAF